MYEQIRVGVVDDQPLFRQGVCHAIASSRRCLLVAHGANHADALRIAQSVTPQVLLLDVNLPGGGIDALRAISDLAASIKTIMLTGSASEDELSASFDAGARGYVTKNVVSPKELIDIVHSVHEGGMYTEPSVAAALLLRRFDKKKNSQDLTESLSKRERDILDLVAEGMTNKEVALHYEIAEKTVKHYMTSILDKLQVRNRVEAALVARNQKINSSRLG